MRNGVHAQLGYDSEIRECDGDAYIVMYACTDRGTFDGAAERLQARKEQCERERRPFRGILVAVRPEHFYVPLETDWSEANLSDSSGSSEDGWSTLQVSYDEGKALAASVCASFHDVCTKHVLEAYLKGIFS